LDSGRGGFYEIPWNPHRYGLTTQDELQQLIVQYLMLFSGDITSFADDAISPTRLRMVVQMNSNDVDTLAMIQSTAQRWLADSLPPSYTIEIAGTADAELEVNKLIVHSQIASIISSMLIVLLILALYYRSVVAGVLGMLCLALPLLFNFGAMGLLGIHLDIATAMISSIAIGIGIDYIIHFMDGYARELQKAGGRWEGITQRTLKSRGPAILFNALSVALGFAVILFSNFKPLNHLGGLIFFTMLNSSLVSLTLLPVILDKMRPSFLLKYHLHTPQKGAL
jgi:predicted RND superfamily exporter protein